MDSDDGHTTISMYLMPLTVHLKMVNFIFIFSEKEMATHSSILAWRIPWKEEPGRVQYMGSQRGGHD